MKEDTSCRQIESAEEKIREESPGGRDDTEPMTIYQSRPPPLALTDTSEYGVHPRPGPAACVVAVTASQEEVQSVFVVQ